jgi:putative flippase GtrA
MNIKSYWFNLDDKIRFLFVGGFNAGISYLIYSILCILMGESMYQIALALSWAITSVISFITQRTLVFEGKGVWYKEYIKCCTTWFFSYLINAGLLEFTVKYCQLNVFLAQLISNFTAAVFTYIVFKLLVFKRKGINEINE